MPLVLQRRRLYILPTRSGLGFAVLVVGMLVAGLNYGNSLALLAAFVLGGFAIVAMNACHRNLLGLGIDAMQANPAFAGDCADLSLELSNGGREPRCGLAVSVAGARAMLPRVESCARGRLHLAVPTQKRGVLALDRVRLESVFPFGLFRCWTWVHAPLELVVFPRPLGTRPPPAAPGENSRGAPSRSLGGDEWRDLRPFRAGDSPRQVAWKAYARGQPLLVKEYGGGVREALHLRLDAAAGDEPESALCQMSRWIVDAEARGARYRVSLPAQEFAENRGAQHQRRCLEALARMP